MANSDNEGIKRVAAKEINTYKQGGETIEAQSFDGPAVGKVKRRGKGKGLGK